MRGIRGGGAGLCVSFAEFHEFCEVSFCFVFVGASDFTAGDFFDHFHDAFVVELCFLGEAGSGVPHSSESVFDLNLKSFSVELKAVAFVLDEFGDDAGNFAVVAFVVPGLVELYPDAGFGFFEQIEFGEVVEPLDDTFGLNDPFKDYGGRCVYFDCQFCFHLGCSVTDYREPIACITNSVLVVNRCVFIYNPCVVGRGVFVVRNVLTYIQYVLFAISVVTLFFVLFLVGDTDIISEPPPWVTTILTAFACLSAIVGAIIHWAGLPPKTSGKETSNLKSDGGEEADPDEDSKA